MQFDIITIFPNLFDSFLNESLMKKSLDKKLNKICVHDLRKWSKGKHKQVDDRPYGGGAGMVLMAEPILNAVKEIKKKNLSRHGVTSKKTKVILLAPSGKQLNEKLVKNFSKKDENLILICGRYEGFDSRIEKIVDEKISVGPYVLSGGELPAMILIESVSRFIPEFLSNPESLQEETSIKDNKKNIQYPQYTRPEVLTINNKKYSVPKILLSGNHKEIKEWRNKNRKEIKI